MMVFSSEVLNFQAIERTCDDVEARVRNGQDWMVWMVWMMCTA